MAPRPVRLTGRGARLAVAGAALALTLYALFQTVLIVAEMEIVVRGEPAIGLVIDVGEERITRRLWTVEVMLAVPRPDGSELTAWAERPTRVTGGWSAPARSPRQGDRIPALVLPDTPPRIVPESAHGSAFGRIATLAFAWGLVAAAWSAVWMVRRRTGPRGPA
jgi:hypothetical protein